MFDKISKDWRNKRSKPWIPFKLLADKALIRWKSCLRTSTRQFIFLDIGAGTGRNAKIFEQWANVLIETDISFEMLKNNRNNSQKVQTSMQYLPFRQNTFNGIFSVAAIHHVKEKENRDIVKSEIIRIGKNDSIIGITVWRLYQPKFIRDYYKQLNQTESLQNKPECGDLNVPWTLSQGENSQIIDRFYHLFRVAEFNHFIKPFRKFFRVSFGNRGKKTNFGFFGMNSLNE